MMEWYIWQHYPPMMRVSCLENRPDNGEGKTRAANKILSHLFEFENAEEIHDAAKFMWLISEDVEMLTNKTYF